MNRPCPVCDGTTADVLHTQRFVLPDGCPLPAEYAVVCCLQCGFVFADVPKADYTGFYREQSKYAAPDGEWDRKRFRDTAADIAAFVTNKDACVLDVGCANGGLLLALRDAGFDSSFLKGIDPSEASVANALKNGIRAETGTFDDLPPGPFDLVVLSHVLEHLPDPKAALRAVADVLAPDGCVYVEVPDAMRYGEFLTSPLLDVNTEHVAHHSMRGLMNLGWACGLKVTLGGFKVLQTPMPYPALFAYFRRGPVEKFVRDDDLRPKMESYLARSREMMRRIDARLSEVKGPVMVWGAGQLTYKLLADTCLRDMPIIAFVDGNPVHQRRMLRDCPILPPQLAANYGPPYPSIVVASLMHERGIVAQIEEMKLPNKVVTLGG